MLKTVKIRIPLGIGIDILHKNRPPDFPGRFDLPAQQSSAPAKVLLEKIDPAGAEGLTPNSFSHRIRKSVDALRRNGITVSFRKSNGDRLICLKRVDGVDDPAAENIVTIDPENPPCFGV